MSRVDQGKLAKQKGAMHPRDARHFDQDPARLPPHKKPKVWRLTVEWTETRTVRRDKAFTSRAARDEARARIERHMREQAAKAEKPKLYRYAYSYHSPFTDFTDTELHCLKHGPVYTETYEDAC